jgi:hypothetical protein
VRNSFSCSSALMREGMESVEEVAPLELAWFSSLPNTWTCSII